MFDKLRKQYYMRFSEDRKYYRMIDRLFGFCADNIELYKLAIIHRSASVVVDGGAHLNNERLEFLGDAVIETIVSDYLFVEYPELDEGDMTKLRSKIVSRVSLNHLAKCIGLDEYMVAVQNGDSTQKNIAGDGLEAMFGAIYLDRGYEFANRIFINDLLSHYIDVDDVENVENDFKSRLLEWCQKSRHTLRFVTRMTSQNGGTPVFNSKVLINGNEMGSGEGGSKKEAEQNAASIVLPLVMSDEVGDYILESIDDISKTINGDAQ